VNAPAAASLPDDTPDVGDYKSLDPLMQDLMRAQQERLGGGGS
jgi:hypothetical protein